MIKLKTKILDTSVQKAFTLSLPLRMVTIFCLMRYAIPFILIFFCYSCKKDSDIILDNEAPYYAEIPTILLENYVNRMYIDLLGREPLDNEMINDVQYLRDADVTIESRDSLLYKIQFGVT